MATLTPRRRATPRASLRCAVTLCRGRGSDVAGTSEDLGPGGMRVTTKRPLKIDEQLGFSLELPDHATVTGTAHVIREVASGVYALRFDGLRPADHDRLWELARRS